TLFIIGLISILLVLITYLDFKKKRRSKWVDVLVFTFTGIVGVVILLLWFATDHTATAFNYNLLWAFPLNLIVFGQLFKNKLRLWLGKYLKLLVILLCLLTLHWLIGVQVYAIGIIPFLIALAIRYVFLISHINSKARQN
ncbi:MAG: hypothetical protein KJO77_00125, partial [Bacteroidia bacterium]|nr:hypothetical protein [Bacteroidia bacterium]